MPEVASTAAEPSLRLRFIPERLRALAVAAGNLAKMLPVARALLPHCEREGYLSVPEAACGVDRLSTTHRGNDIALSGLCSCVAMT